MQVVKVRVNLDMIISNLSELKRGEKIVCKCDLCNRDFSFPQRLRNRNKGLFCSEQCYQESRLKRLAVTCDECGVLFHKHSCIIAKTLHNFCSCKCSSIYKNKHKTWGTRRSKLELWIEKELSALYPSLQILFNDVSAIQCELDIFIPDLDLAFELNGIFHYKEVFDNFQRTKNRDKMKIQLCAQKGIRLCVIDTRNQKSFRIKTSKVFLDIICNIITDRLKT